MNQRLIRVGRINVIRGEPENSDKPADGQIEKLAL
jgi:hypothetical protein